MRLDNNKVLDQNKKIAFFFDGKKYYGYEGDTLASALLANDVHLIGRSFKYHRPRGIISAGCEEPNGIIQLELNEFTEPNRKATEIILYEGLIAKSQNRWPSVKNDFGAINDLLSPFFPAGFYYKTFMWPPKFWKTYEFIIRHAAGLGKSPKKNDPHKYEQFHYHCDVLIVGSGVSGLYASKIAASKNLKVLLVEQEDDIGGSILASSINDRKINNYNQIEWKNKILNELNDCENLKIITSTTIFAYMHYNYLLGIQDLDPKKGIEKKHSIRQILWKIRAKKVILATGSIERPLTFNNNDRPGIMLAGSVKKYINKYGVKLGKKIIIFTNNDSAYQTAIDCHHKKINIKAIIDIRDKIDGDLPSIAKNLGIKIYSGSIITNTTGRKKIKSITIKKYEKNTQNSNENLINLDCDLLCMSGGWSPTVHLFTQSRGKLKFRSEDACFIPDQAYQETLSIGSCNGTFNLSKILQETFDFVNNFLSEYKNNNSLSEIYKAKQISAGKQKNLWLIHDKDKIGKSKMFVDFQNDVTANDINIALSEGFQSIEHAKRYTTNGMATDQGKTSNVNALGIISELTDQNISDLGTTTFRLPYTPVTFGAIAGRFVKEFFDIERTTPMHKWHISNNALFEDVGQWKRPWYYPKDNENMYKAVNREVKATRDSIGILDASTLGKIDIKGRDVSEFLNRVYTNAWSKLEIGKCRYGIMLGDDGMVIDDGVTTRLDEYHYVMTTTTGNAASVMSKLEDWLQTEWPELEVYLTSVTEQFGTISLNGPNSRKLVQSLFPDQNFSNKEFPHMSFKNLKIDSVYCRVMRISFTGEICYEINVPSSYALSLWNKCMDLGKNYNITPYGTEAMHVLRAEKGFIIVGQETDGSVTPLDLDMDWIVSKKKYDFIGKRALYRSDTIKEGRKQLVGLLTKNPNEILEEGAQLVEKKTSLPMNMVGHVTSSYYSPNLGRSIALALVKGGINKKGDTLLVPQHKKTLEVEITNPVFIDPSNERLSL
ncbi:MAG: sarcosine oxidase subunit alpha [Pelagibacteraceae bacterium]|nr:sarcosine oxidase subunit alpha [Pelagibacteraceae bacterium]|tara:strand:- start:3264 stop:6260 length:2997 start_codon:yes stop_codon:yes gene_type:complete